MTDEEKKERNREACRKWRAKNLERERKRQRDRFHNNKEFESARSQRWFHDNPERARELSNQSYHRNKNNDRPSNKANYKMWWSARKRATAQNIIFTLEREDISIPELCPVFGVKLEVGHPQHAPSLDRIKPELGYTKDNIAVICRMANTIKSFGTAEQHRVIADWMDTH